MSGHRSALLAIWTAPALVVLLTTGFVLAGLFPPPSPDLTAAEVTELLYEDVTSLRIGLLISAVAVTLFIPFAAAVASQMRRIEGRGAPMALAMVAGSTMLATLTIVYLFLFLALVLREGRPDELTLAIYDLFWVPFVGIYMPTMLMAASLSVVVLGDRSEDPILPRWIGWLSAWMALGSLAGSTVPFFTSGPFSWNGAIAFYLAFAVFFAWFFPVFLEVRRAIAAQLAGEGR